MHYIAEHGCYRVLNISHFLLMSVKPLSLNLINCFVSVVLFVVSLSVGIGNFRWADVLVMMLMFPATGLTVQLMVPLVGIIFGGVIEAVTTFIAYEFIRIVNIT